MINPGRPDSDEYNSFFAGYVERVPEGNVLELLEKQQEATYALLASLTPEQAQFRPTPEDWNILEVIGHMADGERVFAYRALRFARGDSTPLAAMDQDLFVANANAAQRSLADLLDELATVRQATLTFFRTLDETAWQRRGLASNNPVSVLALAYIIAGHELHHLADFIERYGVPVEEEVLPISKEDLLQQMEEGKELVLTFLTDLPEALLSAPSDEVNWSVKDHMAHLAVWADGMAAHLQGRPRWERMGISRDLWVKSFEEINQVLYHCHRNDSWQAALDAFVQGHERMVEAVQALSWQQLQKPYAYFRPDLQADAGRDPYSMLGYAIGATAGHYDTHLPWMNESLARARQG